LYIVVLVGEEARVSNMPALKLEGCEFRRKAERNSWGGMGPRKNSAISSDMASKIWLCVRCFVLRYPVVELQV
jgi:hypothetical protein